MGGNQEPMTPPPASTPPASPPPAPVPASPAGPSPLDNLVASMGLSQLLVVGGALVLVGVDLVLGWLAQQYFIGDMLWFAGLAIVLAFLFNRRMAAMLPFGYQTVLLVGGAIIAIVGLRGVILDILSFVRAPGAWDAIELLGLVLYTAAVLAVAWGTWLLMRGRR